MPYSVADTNSRGPFLLAKHRYSTQNVRGLQRQTTVITATPALFSMTRVLSMGRTRLRCASTETRRWRPASQQWLGKTKAKPFRENSVYTGMGTAARALAVGCQPFLGTGCAVGSRANRLKNPYSPSNCYEKPNKRR